MKNYTGWQYLPTKQSKEILSELIEAKEQQKALLLISNTGLGKTKTIEMFMRKNAEHTYKITVGDSFKLPDVVDAIIEQLNIDFYARKKEGNAIKGKLTAIAKRLKELQSDNHLPMIVIDEAENLKPSVLKMIKELYDAIHDYASIVLIGTEQILDSILNRRNKNRQSVPQLWRRFKAGTRYISPLKKDRDFKPFFDLYIPGQTSLQGLIISLADNYGELHDFLDPVLIKASKTGKEVTEEYFCLIHKLAS